MPELKFELHRVLVGVKTIVLYYSGARGRFVAELFEFGRDRKVVRASANYAVQGPRRGALSPSFRTARIEWRIQPIPSPSSWIRR